MRVLFFLEPVIFQNNPIFLAAHFFWVDCIKRAIDKTNGQFALTSNFEICQQWRESQCSSGDEIQTFAIDPFESLSKFNYSRHEYCRAIYRSGDIPNGLHDQLQKIRATFDPTLIVMTSQNNLARHAFFDIPTLCIEQAPLPRFGHPLRTVFDPNGHQVGALIETHSDIIKSLPLTESDFENLRQLLNDIEENLVKVDPRAAQAQAILDTIRQEGPVALLVTQPPDWVTYDGAYKTIELESLIYSWANELPAGWIGVPTYHPGYQLNADMELALARANKRIRFLPKEFSTGLTEALLPRADGMITVSSTSAITSLLLKKRTVVVGRSPFNAWTINTPHNIDKAIPLSSSEAASTLAFLTNRYVYVHKELVDNPEPLLTLMNSVTTYSNPAKWFLDLSGWSIDRARSLFHLTS